MIENILSAYKHESYIIFNRRKTKGCEFKLTISVGVSHFKDNDSLEGIVHCADKALYYSKRQGRNRVTYAV